MRTIRYEVQFYDEELNKWRVSSSSNPTKEGLDYALGSAETATNDGQMARVIEIIEQQKLLWPDVGNCG
jgi:hypothetical protein